MSEVLHGNIVRLEPLDYHHAEGLVRASMSDDGLYKWSTVRRNGRGKELYSNWAGMEGRRNSPHMPLFVFMGMSLLALPGFFKLSDGPETDHPRHGRLIRCCGDRPTWLDSPAIRTGVNTEAKFLLQLAFENGRHTDVFTYRCPQRSFKRLLNVSGSRAFFGHNV
jgi:hypothetical protein